MATQARRLGRGLSSLIPSAAAVAGTNSDGQSGTPLQLNVERIQPREDQPRQHFDDHHLRQLAISIREQGVLQPLVVSPRGDGKYDLIAGERRLRASQLAGLSEVPVVIRTADPKEAFELALIENIQRQDLNPIEEAEAYARLMQEHSYTQEALARRIGKERATIANSVRLLKLSTNLRQGLIDGQLSAGHARCLLGLSDQEQQEQLFKRIVDEGLSVRALEQLVGELKGKKPTRRSRPTDPLRSIRHHFSSRLESTLGRSVRIRAKGEGGAVVLSFDDQDDLESLVHLLAAAKSA
jgi:ParB family chromosome partitioning protein